MRHYCFLDCTGTRRRYRFKLSARLEARQALPWVTIALTRLVWGTCSIQPRHTSRCAITQPSCRAQVTRFLAGLGADSHRLVMLSGTSGHLLPESVSCSHQLRYGWSPYWTWDKAEGLRRRKPGLVPCLPLAPDELHYEYRAPQNYPSGGGWEHGSRVGEGVGAPLTPCMM